MTSTTSPDPLFDASEALPRRLIVVGATGSGKTTMARRIAAAIDAPHTELDALYWGPKWQPVGTEIFRARGSERVATPAWVLDGNYSVARDLVWPAAEMLVWLDYSLPHVAVRLVRRTSRRVISREELWSGNVERLSEQLWSRDSIFLWLLKTHGKHRRLYPALLREPAHAHLRVVRLRSPREAERFVARIEASDHER